MRPYTIWSPPYRHNSAGVRALHVLRDDLVAAGCTASMHYEGRHTPDAIVMYPEIITGNPLAATRVTRWLLNKATLPDDGLTYAWVDGMGAPVLTVNVINMDLFAPRPGPRTGTAHWVHKGTPDPALIPPGSRHITHAWPATPAALADVLAGIDHLISFDPFSALNLEATLLGTPVLIHPTGQWTRAEITAQPWMQHGIAWTPADLDHARDTAPLAHPAYSSHVETFPALLHRYIRQTQERWP